MTLTLQQTCPKYQHLPSQQLQQQRKRLQAAQGDRSAFGCNQRTWEIKDKTLPQVGANQLVQYDSFDTWPDSCCVRVYPAGCTDAVKHNSGWAMRNTNNHNSTILKKSCLGILVCSRQCCNASASVNSQRPVRLRPAICDKARRKQIGQRCPRPGCDGEIKLQRCRGLNGYPVTHFWRTEGATVYFQAKGTHDHPRPDSLRRLVIVKSSSKPGQQMKRRPLERTTNTTASRSFHRQSPWTPAASPTTTSSTGASVDADVDSKSITMSQLQPNAAAAAAAGACYTDTGASYYTTPSPTQPQQYFVTSDGVDRRNLFHHQFHLLQQQQQQHEWQPATSLDIPYWSPAPYGDACLTSFPSPPASGDQFSVLGSKNEDGYFSVAENMVSCNEMKFVMPNDSFMTTTSTATTTSCPVYSIDESIATEDAFLQYGHRSMHETAEYHNNSAMSNNSGNVLEEFLTPQQIKFKMSSTHSAQSETAAATETCSQALSSCFNDFFEDVLSVMEANVGGGTGSNIAGH